MKTAREMGIDPGAMILGIVAGTDWGRIRRGLLVEFGLGKNDFRAYEVTSHSMHLLLVEVGAEAATFIKLRHDPTFPTSLQGVQFMSISYGFACSYGKTLVEIKF